MFSFIQLSVSLSEICLSEYQSFYENVFFLYVHYTKACRVHLVQLAKRDATAFNKLYVDWQGSVEKEYLKTVFLKIKVIFLYSIKLLILIPQLLVYIRQTHKVLKQPSC